MNGLPYYKAYPRDFIEGTIGMPFDLKGAYRLLLDLIYMQGGRLPDDARYISGLLGCSVRAWNGYREKLLSLEKIVIIGGSIANYRADKELESLSKLQQSQSEKRTGKSKNRDLQKPVFDQPEPEPDTLREDDESACARQAAGQDRIGPPASQETFFRRVLAAAGINPNDIPSHRWMPPGAEIEVTRWREIDPLLTEDLIVDHIAQSAKRHPERARGPKAFEDGLRALAGTLRAAAPIPFLPASGASRAPDRPNRTLTAEEFQAAVNRGFSGK